MGKYGNIWGNMVSKMAKMNGKMNGKLWMCCISSKMLEVEPKHVFCSTKDMEDVVV